LSTDKTTLKSKIAGLVAKGSTGGQLGVAWGWYMLSPNFGYLWPSASQRPACSGGRRSPPSEADREKRFQFQLAAKNLHGGEARS